MPTPTFLNFVGVFTAQRSSLHIQRPSHSWKRTGSCRDNTSASSSRAGCRWASRQSSTSASAGSDDATADHPSCLHTGLLHLRSRLERRGRITHQQVPAPTGAITNRCRAGGRKRKEEEEVPLEPKWPQATSFISSPPSLNLPVCQIPTYHVPPEIT